MTDAFIDSSVAVSLALREPTAAAMMLRLAPFNAMYASDLLEAELRSVCRREQVDLETSLLNELEVVLPTRTLVSEITRVLDAGYVRGADCWHLATALYLAPDPGELTFVTLDVRQREVAKALGFAT